MAGNRRPTIAFVTLALLAVPPAAGQQLLTYSETDLVRAASAQRAGDETSEPRRFEVAVDFDLLRSAPETILIGTPDGHVLRADLLEFEDRGDGDFLWSGAVAGSSGEPVLLTMVDGGLSGMFAVPGEPQYELQVNEDGIGAVLDPGWLYHSVRMADPTLGAFDTDSDHEWCSVHDPDSGRTDDEEEGLPAAPTAAAAAETVGVGAAQTATAGITLSVDPEEVSETSDAAVPVTVTATLDGGRRIGENLPVTVSVESGTAVSGTDFAAVGNFTVTIFAGALSGSGTFLLDPTDDDYPEPHETVFVTGSASGFHVGPAGIEITSEDKARIDVMVLFTPTVRGILARNDITMEREARIHLDYWTRVLQDAGAAAEYSPVYVGNTPADFNRYVAAGRGFAINGIRNHSRDALRLRDRHDADLVYVMGAGSTAVWHCGQAWRRDIRHQTVRDFRYAGQGTTNYYCGRRDFQRWQNSAHEVGHILGALHERGRNISGTGVVLDQSGVLAPYGFGYNDRSRNPEIVTIMAYGSGGGTRLNHYSNVRTKWRGRAMGRADRNEVDRLIRRTAPDTASYSDYIVPGPPSDLTGVAFPQGMTASVSLTWTDNSDSEAYHLVEYRIGDTGAWGEAARLAANVTQATISGLETGARYGFRIRARNSIDISFSSEIWSVTTPGTSLPAKPTSLAASTPQAAMARLNWMDNAHNETGFTVEYRASGSPSWTAGPMVAADVETADVTGLEHQAEYEFRVGAANDRGTTFSDAVFAVTLPTPAPPDPTAPNPLFGRRLSGDSVHLRWTDRSSDETAFRVQTRIEGAASWTVALTLPAGAAETLLTGLTGNARYEFRIEAVGAGSSSLSEPAVLDLSLEPPPALTLSGRLVRLSDNTWLYADLEWETAQPFPGRYRLWYKPAADPESAWSSRSYTSGSRSTRYQQAASRRIPMQLRVEATNEGGTTFSNVLEVDFGSRFPGRPGGLRAERTAKPTEVTLSWTEASRAIAYKVYYGDVFSPTLYAVYPAQARQAIVTGLKHGNYLFRVEAVHRNGNGSQDVASLRLRRPANAPPAPVSNVEVDYPSLQVMRITWRDNADDETGFVLSVRPDDGHWRDFDAGGPDVKPEGGLTVEASTVYHLRVLAESANGSLNSNIVTFYSTQEPTDVVVTPTSSTDVTLAWTDRANYETRFEVEYKELGVGQSYTAREIRKNRTKAAVSGLKASTSYKFRVRAEVVDAWARLHWEPSTEVKITMPPPSPSGVTAAATGSTSATVAWVDESSDETGFVVESRAPGDSGWAVSGEAGSDETSAEVMGLRPGGTREFRVRASHRVNGLSTPSAVVSLTMPPPPPSGLIATSTGANGVTLAWVDESSDETGFVAEYKLSSASAWTTWATEAAAGARTLTLTGLTAGESYEFRVRAKKGTELSSPSGIAVVDAIGAPSPVSALAATAAGPSTVDLTWTDNSSNETGFVVEYRNAAAGAWTTSSTEAADATSASVSGLRASREYDFRVRATNVHGSTPSSIASLVMPPAPPGDLAGSPDGSTALDLTWTDGASDETGFRVEYRLARTNPWTVSETTGANEATAAVTGLAASTRYEFRVSAVSANGESPSSTLELTMPPAAPSALMASEASATSATLTWTDNSTDETGFVVEYRVFLHQTWMTFATEAAANAGTITVTGLSSGTAYEFRVSAVHGVNGRSSPTDATFLDELGGPAAPSNVMATAMGSTRVSVSWTDNSTDETGFVVEQRRGSDVWATIASAAPNASSADAGPFLGGRAYELRVSSSSATAKRPSASVSLTMPPAAPSGLAAAEDTTTSVALTWTDESFDETGFIVEYRESTVQVWSRHPTGAAADAGTITVTGLASGADHAFRVFANHATHGMSSPTRVAWVNDLGVPPAAVADVSVTATGSTSASVTWTDGATGETGFDVEYRPASGAWTTGASAAADSQFAAITGLSASTVYSFRVTPTGVSPSVPSDPFVLTMPPAAPTNLSGIPDTGASAYLSWWDNSSDEDGFVIEYRLRGAVPWTVYATEPAADSTGATVTGLQSGGEYEFRVFAKHGMHGLSSPSNVARVEALGRPSAPGSVTASVAGPTSVTVSWTSGSSNTTGFQVEHRAGGGSWTVSARVGRSVRSARVGGLSGSTSYDIRVAAVNSLGGTPSAAVSVTMPPAAPSGLQAAGSSTSVVLTWTDNSPDETAFVAEYKAATAQVWATSATEAAADAVSLTVTGLMPGTAYEFRVKAKSANGLSSPSNVAAASTIGETLTIGGLSNAAVAENAPWTSAAPSVAGATGSVTWTVEGVDASAFGIDGSTGVLSMVARDREAPADDDGDNVYAVTVKATDADGISGTAALTLTVTNVNEAPVFSTATPLTLSVVEGTTGSIGSPVTATDPEGGSITYTLTGADASSFDIDSATGQLSVVSGTTLNHERKQSYSFSVVATDGDATPLSASRAVTIGVTDADETLTIGGLSNAAVAENAPWTSAAPSVAGATGSVTWTVEGVDASAFGIDGSTGVLSMVARDREAPADDDGDNVYAVTVKATDADGISGTAALTLTVTNVNEAPVFSTATPLTLSVVEGTTGSIGSPVTATDPEGGSITYTLTGADASSFDIDSATGQLSVVSGTTLNHERKQSYSFSVVATDGDATPLSASRAVTIGVTDADETLTIGGLSNAAVAENAPWTSAAPSVAGATGSVTWTVEGVDASAFGIDGSTGVLSMVARDREAPADDDGDNVYAVTVKATDADGIVGTAALTLTVTNVNEAPVFSTATPLTLSVVEGTTGAIGSPVAATDPEGGAVAYSLTGADASSFAIDSATGQLSVVSGTTPDHERKQSYSFSVVATDGDATPLSASRAVTVSVSEVRVILPTAPSGVAAAARGSTGATVTWRDNSSDESGFVVEYRTGSQPWTAGATVSAGETEAAITGLSPSTSYDFRVSATNANGSSASETASLAMPPAEVSDVAGSASDGTSVLLTWRDNSSDETGFVVEYREARTEVWTAFGTQARADATSITVSGLTAGRSYDFRVFARHAANGLSSPSEVKRVGAFGAPTPPTDLTSSAVDATSVRLEWMDASTDETGFEVEYREANPGVWRKFETVASANATSIVVTGLAAGTEYEFRVMAKSASGLSTPSSPRTGTTREAPPILPPPNRPPRFDQDGPLTLTVVEGVAGRIGSPVTATDPEGGSITYTLTGADASSFAIDSATGQLSVASGTTLNYERKQSYSFSVVATDGDATPLSASRAVTIGVTDADETLTVGGLSNAAVAENAPWTSAAPSVAGATGSVTWTVEGVDASAFGIDGSTGVLSMVARDREAPADDDGDNVYAVTVKATDADGISGTAALTLTVTNVNEAPVFSTATPLTLSVVEGSTGSIGSPVAATDPEGDRVSYSLGGPDARTFRVGRLSGSLSLSGRTSLDASRRDAYEFTVTASDGDLSALLAVTVTVVEPEPPGGTPGDLSPAAPSDLEVLLVTSRVVALSWSDNADDETGHDLYYREDTGDWTALRSVGAGVTTATIEELAAGVEYEFVVLAVNGHGRASSNVAAIELSLAPPTHVDAVMASPDGARVTWRDNSIAETGFEVRIRPAAANGAAPEADGEDAADGSWTVAASVPADATAAMIGGLEPGQRYLLQVAALNAAAAPAPSRTGAFTPRAPPADGTLTDCEPRTGVTTLSGDYEIRMCFEMPSGAQADAADYHLESTASGLLWFFERDNVEVLVKVLDGCAINDHGWVFVAPVTTLAFNLEIVERGTGRRFTHRNPRSRTAAAVSDTAAFPCDPGAPAVTDASVSSVDAPRGDDAAPPACEPEGPGIVLEHGHRIDMCFVLPDGEVRQARNWGLARNSSALLYFFDRENAEVLVKVLDGCAVNGRTWVFAAPATDLAFHLVVTDPTGHRWTHANTAEYAATPRSDTDAFACR